MTHEWLSTLQPDTKERIFAAMRAIDTRAQRYLETGNHMGRGTGMSIPIGAAHFDELLRGEVLCSYLRAIRKGASPTEAIDTAKAEIRSIIKSHNSKRAKDVCWQRADMAGDSTVEYAHRQILDALMMREAVQS